MGKLSLQRLPPPEGETPPPRRRVPFGPSALGSGNLPQFLSKNLLWKVQSCLPASLSVGAWGRGGTGSSGLGRGGGALIPPPAEDAALCVLRQTQPWAGGISNISKRMAEPEGDSGPSPTLCQGGEERTEVQSTRDELQERC